MKEKNGSSCSGLGCLSVGVLTTVLCGFYTIDPKIPPVIDNTVNIIASNINSVLAPGQPLGEAVKWLITDSNACHLGIVGFGALVIYMAWCAEKVTKYPNGKNK